MWEIHDIKHISHKGRYLAANILGNVKLTKLKNYVYQNVLSRWARYRMLHILAGHLMQNTFSSCRLATANVLMLISILGNVHFSTYKVNTRVDYNVSFVLAFAEINL